MLSHSFVTRERGKLAFDKLRPLSSELDDIDTILLESNEDDIISFSYIDELMSGCHNYVKQRIIFLLPKGTKSNLYKKLARFSGLRNIDVEYIISESSKTQKVKPTTPITLPEFEYQGNRNNK